MEARFDFQQHAPSVRPFFTCDREIDDQFPVNATHEISNPSDWHLNPSDWTRNTQVLLCMDTAAISEAARTMGRKGGRSTSPAKQAAARANGAKRGQTGYLKNDTPAPRPVLIEQASK